MKQIDSIQILRWSIPGLTTLIMFILFTLIYIYLNIINGVSNKHLIINITNLTITLSKISFAAAVAVLVVGGISIGFVIYQIYICGHWIWRDVKNRLFIEKNIIDKIINGINCDSLYYFSGWRKDYINKKEVFNSKKVKKIKDAWFILGNLFVDFGGVNKSINNLNERRNYLIDIYHSIGASMSAIVFGFGLFILFINLFNKDPCMLYKSTLFFSCSSYSIVISFVISIIYMFFLKPISRIPTFHFLSGWTAIITSIIAIVLSYSIYTLYYQQQFILFHSVLFSFSVFVILINIFLSNWNSIEKQIICLSNYMLSKIVNEFDETKWQLIR